MLFTGLLAGWMSHVKEYVVLDIRIIICNILKML